MMTFRYRVLRPTKARLPSLNARNFSSTKAGIGSASQDSFALGVGQKLASFVRTDEGVPEFS